MSRKAKINLKINSGIIKPEMPETVVNTTEVSPIEEVQKEEMFVDNNVSSEKVSEKQEAETEIEAGIEETVEVTEPIVTDEKSKSKEKYNKNIDFAGRGFSSFEKAVKFIETSYFKGLGKEDQEEYLNWLKS